MSHLSDLNQREFYKPNQRGFSYQRSIVSVVGRDGVWPRGQKGAAAHTTQCSSGHERTDTKNFKAEQKACNENSSRSRKAKGREGQWVRRVSQQLRT